MTTVPKHSKLEDSNDTGSRCGQSVKSSHTEATEALTILDDHSDTEIDLEGLDELEKDMLNWAEGRKKKTEKAPTKPSQSNPVTPVRSPRRKKNRVQRTRSAGSLGQRNGQQKAFENRLRRAMTLNSYEQEKKKEESAAMKESQEKKARHPEECLKLLLQGVSAKTFQSETWATYFTGITPERVAAHSNEVSQAIRKGDLDQLKQLHAKGVPLDGCNHHGESTISLACRLSKCDVVKFLADEAKVSVRVRDDMGRTPLHDAAWTPTPNFELIRFILNQSPELLFIADNRGFTALRYIPQSCWDDWCDFMEESLTFLRLKINHSEFLSAHCQLDDAQERLQALMRRAASYAA